MLINMAVSMRGTATSDQSARAVHDFDANVVQQPSPLAAELPRAHERSFPHDSSPLRGQVASLESSGL